MSNNKYYPNNGRECVRSSLANLLVEMNDPDMAKVVYDSYREHELVAVDGSLPYIILPRVMMDLTNRKYSGVLYTNLRLGPKTLTSLKEFNGEKSDQILRSYHEDLKNGVIRDAPSTLHFSDPVILTIEPKVLPIADGKIEVISEAKDINHALVMKDENNFIDNGFEMNYNLEDLYITGVFKSNTTSKKP